jgi:MFS family permease
MVLTTLVLLVRARRISMFGFGDQGTSGVLMGVLVLTSAIVMPLAGRWGDRFKLHSPIALGGLVIVVPSLVIVALTSAASGLLAGLALMGLGVGAMSPALLALVGNAVSEDHRGRAVGMLQLCSDFGGMLGPLVGTALFTKSLRAPYVATAALLAAFRSVRDSPLATPATSIAHCDRIS